MAIFQKQINFNIFKLLIKLYVDDNEMYGLQVSVFNKERIIANFETFNDIDVFLEELDEMKKNLKELELCQD